MSIAMFEPLNVQLRAARTAAGLSVSEVARRAGTSRAAIASYEGGVVSPSLVTAQRVLAAVGCTLVVQPSLPEALVGRAGCAVKTTRVTR